MANPKPLDPSFALTPSELVLLSGEQFANKVLAGNIKLLHSEASVSVSQLGQAMLAAAFLVNEKSGTTKLEIRQKKAMLGLRKVNSLYVVPANAAVVWPEYSFENQIYALAEKLGDKNEMSRIVYTWLVEDSGSPWNAVIHEVKEGLSKRGLIDRTEQKKLKVFTSVKHELPADTFTLAEQARVDAVKQLLTHCQSSRKEIWGLLVKQLKKAISDRTEQSDSDF